MRKQKGVFLVAVLALAAIACEGFFSPSVTVTNEQDNSAVSVAEPSPAPSVCQAVVSVEISAPTAMADGETVPIDATPRDSTGPRLEECDIASGITWTTGGPCRIAAPNAFTPDLTATGPGVCALEAQVEQVVAKHEVTIQ